MASCMLAKDSGIKQKKNVAWSAVACTLTMGGPKPQPSQTQEDKTAKIGRRGAGGGSGDCLAVN